MSQSIKLKNNTYLDSSSITDDRKKLSDMLNGTSPMGNIVVDSIRSKNMFNINAISRGYELIGTGSYAGGVNPNVDWFVSDYIEVKPNTSYYLTKGSSGISNCLYDSNKTYISTLAISRGVITIPNNSNIKYMRFNGLLSQLDEVQLEKGTSATTYAPYQGLLDENNIKNKELVVGGISGKNLFNINGEVNAKGNDTSVYGTSNTVSGNVLTCNYNSANSHGFGQRFTNLNGKTITVSAKVVSNGTGTGGHFIIYDNNSSVEDITITSGNTNYITYTCTSNNVVVAFSTAAGTGAQYTDIQVEIGSSKTDYAEFQGVGYVSGQNSNGNYIKYDDGTLIQWGESSITATINVSWGNLYTCSNTINITYPIEFIDTPSFNTTIKGTSSAILINWSQSSNYNKYSDSYVFARGDNTTDSRTYKIQWIAIGRWKW